MKPDEIASNRFVLDMKSAQDLRSKLQQNPKAGIKDAARQFEGMFLQMVMKSMRDATPSDGPMNSDATRFYTSVLDQQLATQFGASGQFGFARLIEAQLSRTMLPAEGAGSSTTQRSRAPNVFSGQTATPAGGDPGGGKVCRQYGRCRADLAGGNWPGLAVRPRFCCPRLAARCGRRARPPVCRPISWSHMPRSSRAGAEEIRRADGTTSHNLLASRRAGAGKVTSSRRPRPSTSMASRSSRRKIPGLRLVCRGLP